MVVMVGGETVNMRFSRATTVFFTIVKRRRRNDAVTQEMQISLRHRVVASPRFISNNKNGPVPFLYVNRFPRYRGDHDHWTNGKIFESVPRHAEINENLARKILRTAKNNPPQEE